MQYFLRRLLAWSVYLALVGLAGGLVFLVLKWGVALDVGAFALGGIGLIILAVLLFYVVLVFGFFALVSKVPM